MRRAAFRERPERAVVVRLLWILLCVATICCARHASAGTVAILRPSNDAPALNEALFRIKGELLAVGLAVAITERPPVLDTASVEATAWFERTAAERSIDAFIDVMGDVRPVGVDIWICEREPRKLRAARVMLEPNTEDAPATLAIRAIEVLRSSFLAIELLGANDARAPVVPPPPPPPVNPPAPRVARFAVEAGATALTSLDGVGLSVLPFVGAEWAFRPWLSLQATGAAFGTRPTLEVPAGSVDISQEFGLLGLCVCALANTGVHPLIALSAGALHTALEGRAGAPNLGHRTDEWAFLVDGSVGVRLSLPDRFYVAFASHIQFATPYVAVHVLDDVVATTGRPNLSLTLTVGARL